MLSKIQKVLCYHFLHLPCCFEVVGFDLRKAASIFDVGVELVVMLADVGEGLDAKPNRVEGMILLWSTRPCLWW